MTRWRTDKPVPPLRRTPAVARIAPVDMFRINPVASRAQATAHAFYARKLRLWAKAREQNRDDESDGA
jgi:hypothetical protein